MKFLHLLTALGTASGLLFPALSVLAADQYPSRPIRMIVPYPPGGGSDLTGRAIGLKLNASLGQTVVIDNRPGATGLIGTEIAAKAPADGYTIVLADAPHTINALVYTRKRYDAIKDFEPINLVATSPQGLFSSASFEVPNLKALLAMPRAQTEKLAMGSSGLASGPHMIYEALRLKTGLTLNHVPYKGGGPSLADAAGGQIPLVMNAVPAAMPYVKSGRLRPLAITSAKRHPQLPDVQTFQEAGVKDFVTFQWYGVLAPARTPKDVVARLNRDINQAITAPDVKDRFSSLTFDVTPGTPDAFLRLLVDEDRRWKEVLKQVKVSLD